MALNTQHTEANKQGFYAGNKEKQNKQSGYIQKQSKGTIVKVMGNNETNIKLPARAKPSQTSKKEMKLR